MLNKLDDFPIHQTPEPVAIPASSDRNVYDRTWFNGYAADGSAYFGIGIAIYPHRRVLDCAFSVVHRGERQHCFFGSRLAPLERTEMRVGPFSLEIVEPLRIARVVLDDNDTGIACDLRFEARTSAIQEARQILWSGTRKVMDATRFAQFGRWVGEVVHPDGSTRVDDWFGTKDRSWGIRGVGEPDPPGAPGGLRSAFFLWAPLFWSDHISHAVFFDGPRGEALVREGLTAPLYDKPAAIPQSLIDTETHMATAAHRITYRTGSRLAEYAEIDLVPLEGPVRTIAFEPLLRFHMKGLGYGHPVWNQGTWHGELATASESFDPDELDLLRPENIHVQQICRVSDGRETGLGALEQVVVGPYAPAGFVDAFDGAR